MQYDPRRPHAHRYVLDAPPIDLAMYRRVEGDCLKLCRALGYDLNTVEFAVEDGIPYAIDFLNPAPDAELTIGREGRISSGSWTPWPNMRSKRPSKSRNRWKCAGRVSCHDAAKLHHRHRGGVSDHRSGDARPALAHRCRNHRQGQDAAQGSGEGGDASERGRGRHGHLQRTFKRLARKSGSCAARSSRWLAKTACTWRHPGPIRSRTGANRKFIPTSDTTPSSRI